MVVSVAVIDEPERSAATPNEPSPCVVTLPPLRTTLPPKVATAPGASAPLVMIEAPPIVIAEPVPEAKTAIEPAPVVVMLAGSDVPTAPAAISPPSVA